MIAKRLKEFRETITKNASEFARSNNIEVRTYASYERGERNPSFEVLEHLVQKYDLNLNWLIAGAGDMFFLQQQKLLKAEVMDEFADFLKSRESK